MPLSPQYDHLRGAADSNGTAASGERSWASGTHNQALANLAHELRTPVQAILGYLDMLRDPDADLSQKKLRAAIERMNANVHDLAQTVENLLEFAFVQGEGEAVTEEEINLQELLAEIEPVLQAANQDKQLAISLDLDAAARVVRSRLRPLRAILLNLAINAIKFTPSGSVAIAIREDHSSDSAMSVEVRDTGPGIRSDLVGRAFEPLVQLSQSSIREHRGLGLGLAIVNRNVTALGGKLLLESSPGAGSCFRVTIPCSFVRRQ